jgi:hypothetical protein
MPRDGRSERPYIKAMSTILLIAVFGFLWITVLAAVCGILEMPEKPVERWLRGNW